MNDNPNCFEPTIKNKLKKPSLVRYHEIANLERQGEQNNQPTYLTNHAEFSKTVNFCTRRPYASEL